MVIDGLGGNVHFLSMVVSFAMKTLFEKQGVVSTLEGMLRIYRYPNLRLCLGPVLNSLGCIWMIAGNSKIVGSVCGPATCPLHLPDLASEEFLFCNLSKMFNIFTTEESST